MSLLKRSKKFSEYEELKERPRLRSMNSQKMLVLTGYGDPDKASGEAISALFKAYYQLKHAIKDLPPAAPRARWLQPVGKPKEEWAGFFGVPVPEEADRSMLSEDAREAGITIEHWDYGEVAEIMHEGPYDKEESDVETLHRFIDEQGYRIAGMHEEEYIKGPGMIFRGNPDKYLTIIRYPVVRK